MENLNELQDLLESMRNNIDISLFLIAAGKVNLLPTPLEAIHEQSQQVIEGWCIKEGNDAMQM
jgi:hypothetical protein